MLNKVFPQHVVKIVSDFQLQLIIVLWDINQQMCFIYNRRGNHITTLLTPNLCIMEIISEEINA